MRSIRSTDCSVISQGEDLFRTTFRTISHSWMLGMSVICFRLQFILQFVRGQKEVIFAKNAQAYFSCAQDVKLYSCLHHQSSESELLPNYESRTWDAKTRKLLSYRIVISGKIQYSRTFFSEAYSLKEFCHFSMHA